MPDLLDTFEAADLAGMGSPIEEPVSIVVEAAATTPQHVLPPSAERELSLGPAVQPLRCAASQPQQERAILRHEVFHSQ